MSRVLLGLFTSAALIGCTIYQDQPPATPAAAQPAPPPPAYAQPAPGEPAYAPPPPPEPAYAPPPATPAYAPPPAPPATTGPRIVATPPARPVVAPTAVAGGIQVLSATYGANCNQRPGNVTQHVAGQCNGQARCDYRIDHKLIGDPAYGCQKDYAVEWSCGGGQTFRASASPEAGWGDKSVTLSCTGAVPPPVATPTPHHGGHNAIQVVAATFGANCSGVVRGNATNHIAAQCNGQPRCDYRIDYKLIGDPAHGCQKDFDVEWRCGGRTFNAQVAREAGWGNKSVTLSCDPGYTGSTSRPAAPVLPTPAPVPPPVATVGGVQVVSATYGGNCNQRPGNVTSHIAGQCNGQARCDYRIDHKLIGDPAYGCSKDYRVEWRCGGRTFDAQVGAEAGWGDKSVTLSCEGAYTGPTSRPAPPVAAPSTPPAPINLRAIQVVSATYGANCNGVAKGNATAHVAGQCNGQIRCEYRIDHKIIGDAAPGCSKDYIVEWRCGGRTFTATAAREAGWGDKSVTLSCEPAFTGPMR